MMVPVLWVFVGRLVKPLELLAGAMHQTANKMRDGLTVTPIQALGGQEIQTVGLAFNEFVEARIRAFVGDEPGSTEPEIVDGVSGDTRETKAALRRLLHRDARQADHHHQRLALAKCLLEMLLQCRGHGQTTGFGVKRHGSSGQARQQQFAAGRQLHLAENRFHRASCSISR
jgi:hypothetical protein